MMNILVMNKQKPRVTAEMFKSLLAEICNFNTVNYFVSDHPWCTTKWSLNYGRCSSTENQENKLKLN